MRQWVPSLDWLREAAQQDGGLEVCLHLNGGLFSRKDIHFNASDERWQVYNHIDDTTHEGITDDELRESTNIVRGIEQSALSYETMEVAHGTTID